MSGFESDLDSGDAPGWNPEETDVLIGTVLALSKGWSDYKNGFYPIVTLQPDLDRCNPSPPRIKDGDLGDGAIAAHGFQFVMEDRLTALRPKVGEVLGFKVGPKIPTKDGKRSVQTYTIKVEGRSEDIWSEIKNPRLQNEQPAVQATQTQMQTDDDIPF